ncbi:syntaxin-binding protein 5-like isoform X3 [Phyllobates terribilis]|uniref:syntaxin-binding protein 5-like isoform X3 n=1 Tax=Phyllobates terribilis TaxID=111132 RepID=UPI003CCB617C
MKTIRKVLDGLTASTPVGAGVGGGTGGGCAVYPPGQPGAVVSPREPEIQESLTSEQFQVCKTVRHGFPYQPTALAFDPVQKILAIGTRSGGVRILGRPGVDCHCQHESGAAVLHLQFLINEGALVAACADETLHLWSLRQKRPAVLHSLRFNKERITCCHLPFQSKWLYVGTERGNTHIVNILSFVLSGYVVMWNKAIELSTKTHPGPVVHLSDTPRDEGKLLIGYESGTIVLWDLRCKRADLRFYYDEAIHSIGWHHEGRQFMCSHSDGSLTVWNVKNPAKPFQVTIPHGKSQRDGRKHESCKPILKVEYRTCKNSEPFIIFSGGLSYDSRRPSLTIMHGKAITVLEMDHPIVDFLTLCETPYPNEFQEPYAVAVLMERDVIVVDLTQSNFPIFENPYSMDIHESPVTCTEYFADCPHEFILVLYALGAKHKKQGYSNREWPITGGIWNLGTTAYPEIIVTGHADGSVKFWDASATSLQMLYKLKTSKVFEKLKPGEGKQTAEIVEDDPFAIQMMSWCPESRILCVAGVSAYVIIYRFSKHEVVTEIASLEVRLQNEMEDIMTPDPDSVPPFPEPSSQPLSSKSRNPAGSANTVTSEGPLKDSIPCLSVKSRPVRMPPGYQTDLVVQLVWTDGEPPQQITSLAVSSAYGLVAFGNSNGLAVVDYIQKTILLSMGTVYLYGASDPYQRQPRSPRKSKQFPTDNFCMRGLSNFYPDITKRIRTSYQSLTELTDSPVSLELDRCKSPTSDHVNGHCTSPTSQSCGSGKRISSADGTKANRRGPGRPPFRKAQSAACMEITLPVTTEAVGYISRRAMLQQLHGVSTYSNDEYHYSTNSWAEKESRENSFSRSRSSSVSSIDKEAKEAITALYFMETFARKNDQAPSPCLWVGTSLGTVLVVSLNIPVSEEQRQSEPVQVSPSGTVLTMKGAVLTFSSLDCMGSLIHPSYEVWRDLNSGEDNEKTRKRKLVAFSPSSSQDIGDHQFAVVCSEKQAKVFSLPSQTCLYVHNITETSFLLRADVVTMCNTVLLACFCANGHIMTISLPSLRPLLDINYLPLTDMRIARTFCFTNHGQALYLCSPSEIQRITYSQEMCESLQETLGDLFSMVETPEAQNRGFLKGLFGGSGQTLDREELFGQATAGIGSRYLAEHIPGQRSVEGVKGAATGVVGDLNRVRQALDERGQRLGELEDKTERMLSSAEAFSKHAHELMLKCKDKKWYQF